MKQYGADGVRVGMLLCSPAGNDLPFDEGLCEQGRNFSNKIWNAFRLIKGWKVEDIDQTESAKQAINWFENKISKSISEIDESYSKYRISEALMSTYKLVWDDFCSWYLEMVKPDYESPIDRITYQKTIENLEKLLKLLHPFMPFLSEEIWHLIDDRNEDIIVSDWPKSEKFDDIILDDFDIVSDVVSSVRNFRKQKQIAQKYHISLFVKLNESHSKNMDPIICKLGNIENVEYTNNEIDGSFSFRVKSNEYFIPLDGNVDLEAELEKLQKELDYTNGFLKSVNGKLMNEKFVKGAPEQVVINEKKKQSDALQKIEILEKQISSIQNV
jgi:valyl-tRNA synthetase